MTPKKQIALASVVSGTFAGMLIGSYAAKTARSPKPSLWKSALGGGFMGAVSSILPALILPMFLGEEAVSGLGLLNVQKSMGRMGIYMPEPTVKKFSSFTGTRYYS